MLEKYKQAVMQMEKENNFFGMIATILLGVFWAIFLAVLLICFISWSKLGLGMVRAGIVLILFTFAHFYIVTSLYVKK